MTQLLTINPAVLLGTAVSVLTVSTWLWILHPAGQFAP